MILEELANIIVKEQNFDFMSFQDAKMIMEVEINNIQSRLSYDRLTTTMYSCEPKLNLHALINNGLLKKLSWDQLNIWYEYQALFWYCFSNDIEYPFIKKAIRPDFVVTDIDGRKIGIEIMQLTSEIDRKRAAVQRLFGKMPFDESKEAIKKYLKNDALEFEIKPMGNSFVFFPKEATCLSVQREKNAKKLYEKYEKYFIKDRIGRNFDKFIILGNALHSEIAITNKDEASHVLEELNEYHFDDKVEFIILFQDYDTKCIFSKRIVFGNENKKYDKSI